MKKTILAVVMTATLHTAMADTPTVWTLQQCIDHALQHNITLNTGRLSVLSAQEDTRESQAALLPSLSLSTTHQLGYQPFMDNGSSADKASYSGDYGLNANWTVWDGKRRRYNITQSERIDRQAQLTVEENSNNIQEQIVQLFVQILYVNESVNVHQEILDISRQNVLRGTEMYRVGKLSKADLSQLEAQAATDEYNLVNAKGTLDEYKLQMKELLRLDYAADFDVAVPSASDRQALADIPPADRVMTAALAMRPEMQQAAIDIERGKTDIDIARTGKMPTVALQGGIGTNTMTGTGTSWGCQMPDNMRGSLGVTLSVPLSDNRSTKTAVNKAKLALQQAQLKEEDARRSLQLTIQGFWINATTNQQRYKAAKASVVSAQDSYELLGEQFRLGLKNIVELTNAKTTLLNAQQSRLESKYTTLLYLQLLHFYENGNMESFN